MNKQYAEWESEFKKLMAERIGALSTREWDTAGLREYRPGALYKRGLSPQQAVDFAVASGYHWDGPRYGDDWHPEGNAD